MAQAGEKKTMALKGGAGARTTTRIIMFRPTAGLARNYHPPHDGATPCKRDRTASHDARKRDRTARHDRRLHGGADEG